MPDLNRLRSLDGVKWSRYGPDVLPAWVADMDFEPASAIKDALFSMTGRGDLGYSFGGLQDMTEAWANWQQDRHRWRPPSDQILHFTGSLHALDTTMMLHTSPGDGVVIFSPIYYPFRDSIERSGRRVVDVPLEDGTWRLDAERFEAALDPGTKLVLFCQPHNPVGRVFDAEELVAFADVVERHDLLVVSDEIWADLTHDPHRHLPLVVADERLVERSITLGSASKAFNIAGLRCSVAHVGSPDLRSAIDALPPHAVGSPASTSVAATLAAWTRCDDWLDKTRCEISARRDHLVKRVAAELPQVGATVPEATYLAWLDFSHTTLGDDPSKTLLKQAGVALDAGLKFGSQGVGWARLNFATSEEILDQILDRVIDAVNKEITP